METIEIVKALLVRSGTAWVLWLLFALSVGSVAVAVERWLVLHSKDTGLAALAARVELALASGSLEALAEALHSERSFAATVVLAGARFGERGATAAEAAMQSTIAIERCVLERRLAFLGTLGNNAPFVGLFGTVIGVILAFEQLGHAAAAGGSGSPVATTAVMSAIAEALVATAVGIGVALPAVAFYNYFQRRIATMVANAEALAALVLAHLKSAERAQPASVMRRAETTLEPDLLHEVRAAVRARRVL
jgi:biopolymer transport protein ExbB